MVFSCDSYIQVCPRTTVCTADMPCCAYLLLWRFVASSTNLHALFTRATSIVCSSKTVLSNTPFSWFQAWLSQHSLFSASSSHHFPHLHHVGGFWAVGGPPIRDAVDHHRWGYCLANLVTMYPVSVISKYSALIAWYNAFKTLQRTQTM